ncbi:hypothetical protein CERSUDRAFT_61406 [Gelatoporia subvermispora B]|uniref:Uncharacterized protein n=1 Tax=Ceriporiopsis subvermispora (strain B) TaxID=914234 RepID=M2RR39_CERS8|nr:hypothetical protein CERSUDRAFT_61406 [Gelatoporia subvermispora B]
MARLIEKHKQDMIALREEFEAMIKSRDEQAQKEIVAERQKMQAEIQKWQNAVIELKKGLDSVKAQAEQDRRTTEAEKEKRRAKFLAQIAVERQRWEKTARETAEKKQFNEKTLQEQFGAKIKDANTRTERLQNQLERDRELLRKTQTASLAEPQKRREVQVRASLSYATDWAKVEITTYGTAFIKDPSVGSEVYRNVTITPTSLMISRPFSEAFRSGRVSFIIVNQGNPIDITTTHGRDRYRLGDRGGCATVEFSNNQYVNSKGQDRDNRMVFSNCVMRA